MKIPIHAVWPGVVSVATRRPLGKVVTFVGGRFNKAESIWYDGGRGPQYALRNCIIHIKPCIYRDAQLGATHPGQKSTVVKVIGAWHASHRAGEPTGSRNNEFSRERGKDLAA
jgi:hypothetical protein